MVTSTTLLLLDDIPNCDLEPTHPCATGTLVGDIDMWTKDLVNCSLHAWGVWAAVDGGTNDGNFYGDLNSNGTTLTIKGMLHRKRALQLKI